jgi:hypothetical protein
MRSSSHFAPIRLLLVLLALTFSFSARHVAADDDDDDEKGETLKASGIPAAIRHRVHLSATKVPEFPHNDRRLLRAKDWPETMVIGGVRSTRRIHAWNDMNEGVAVKSIRDVKRGWRYMQFYDQTNSKWSSGSVGWGPRYTWNADNRLIERIWYEPDSVRLVTHDYTYYKNGRLLGYSFRSEPRHDRAAKNDTLEFLSEFFDSDGNLIAVAYEKKRARDNESLFAWMGSAIPYDDFRMRTHILFSGAHPGNR